MYWIAVVAFRGSLGSKSRLSQGRAGLSPNHALRLARSFAWDLVDTLAEVSEVRQVVVLTKNPSVWQHPCAAGEQILADQAPDLNSALREAGRQLRADSPNAGLIMLPADLPAVTATDIAGMLRQAVSVERAFVADRDGVGTTALSALPGVPIAPKFGSRSADQHATSGYVELAVPGSSALRQDVDTLEDLSRVAEMGLRQHASTELLRMPQD